MTERHGRHALGRRAALALLFPCGIAVASEIPRPPSTAPTAGPTTAESVFRRELPRAVEEGVAFLVHSQNADGSWGTGLETRGLEIYSMVPGSHDAFRVATTALCVLALRENDTLPGAQQALRRGLDYLIASGEARRDDGSLLYNVWAHTYALQALSVEMRHAPEEARRRTLRGVAEWHLDRMKRYETYMGGWNYYDFRSRTATPSGGPTSFGTAAGLVALWEAQQGGIDIPPTMIERCIKRLEECRLPDGNFIYGHDQKYNPRMGANRARGSIGRTQAGNFALWLWGSGIVDEARAVAGLRTFFDEHAFLAMGRKRPWPHEAWYQTSGYYYYFGHYYAARLLDKLSPTDAARFAGQLAEKVLPYQEADGSWWDYAMWDYHKPYGTAFAVMTLKRCGAHRQ